MLRALSCLLIAVIFYLLFSYLKNYQPEIARDLLIDVDIFGLSDIANEEHIRLASIQRLPIAYEEKQVLIKRTVFMGCSPDMLLLALGKPTRAPIEKFWKEQKKMLVYYVYFLPGDKRPTIMVFEENKLIYAYKDSALAWNQ